MPHVPFPVTPLPPHKGSIFYIYICFWFKLNKLNILSSLNSTRVIPRPPSKRFKTTARLMEMRLELILNGLIQTSLAVAFRQWTQSNVGKSHVARFRSLRGSNKSLIYDSREEDNIRANIFSIELQTWHFHFSIGHLTYQLSSPRTSFPFSWSITESEESSKILFDVSIGHFVDVDTEKCVIVATVCSCSRNITIYFSLKFRFCFITFLTIPLLKKFKVFFIIFWSIYFVYLRFLGVQ